MVLGSKDPAGFLPKSLLFQRLKNLSNSLLLPYQVCPVFLQFSVWFLGGSKVSIMALPLQLLRSQGEMPAPTQCSAPRPVQRPQANGTPQPRSSLVKCSCVPTCSLLSLPFRQSGQNYVRPNQVILESNIPTSLLFWKWRNRPRGVSLFGQWCFSTVELQDLQPARAQTASLSVGPSLPCQVPPHRHRTFLLDPWPALT